jgi:arginyl-tRNA synthetase
VNIQALLSEKVSQALIAAGAPADCEPQVRQSAKIQFGDYQANGVMAVAKKLGMAPRQLAEQVLSHLDLNGIANKVEIAGPGFINIFLDPAFLAENVNSALASERLGVARRRRKLSSLTTPRRTSPKRCTSAICVPPSSVTPSVRWSSSVIR